MNNAFNALGRVVPSHLMDASLHDFAQLCATGAANPAGEIAFDAEPCVEQAAA